MNAPQTIEEVKVTRPSRVGIIAITAVLAVAVAFMLYPVVTNNIPPLVDYSEHLSSVFVLYNLIHGTAFMEMYRIHLALIPNLAVDGVILPLMELGLPIEIAGRCFLVLMLLALALGVISLHYAAFRRMSIWPVVALPFLYQDFLFEGFYYLLGVGLALMTVAYWRLNAGSNLVRAGAALLLSSLVLFFCHLVALLLALGLVIGVEISGLLRLDSRRTKQAGGSQSLRLARRLACCSSRRSRISRSRGIHRSGHDFGGPNLPTMSSLSSSATGEFATATLRPRPR